MFDQVLFDSWGFDMFDCHKHRLILFDGTSAVVHKPKTSRAYCALMDGHAMCDVFTWSSPPDQPVAKRNVFNPISLLSLQQSSFDKVSGVCF